MYWKTHRESKSAQLITSTIANRIARNHYQNVSNSAAMSEKTYFVPLRTVTFPKPNRSLGAPYFASLETQDKNIDRSIDKKSTTELVIFTIYKMEDIEITSHARLIELGYGLAACSDERNVTNEAGRFVLQASKDCVVRAKRIATSAYHGNLEVAFKLKGSIIAMAMDYYHRVGRPCNGHHELFFNGLLYVLLGMVGCTTKEVMDNMRLFKAFNIDGPKSARRYTRDPILIEPFAGEEDCEFVTFDTLGGKGLPSHESEDDNDDDMAEL